ncbi:hypothetical protein BH24BAC1_BH24BAC1_13740 [soil metagenome]
METPVEAAPAATTAQNREALLHRIARQYVEEGLGGKNFDAIPYAEDVTLRAPLCPGGSTHPLTGKENLRTIWWAPLPGLLGKVEVLDTFVNKSATATAVEFHLEVLTSPPLLLRVLDRFTIDEAGEITEQENFFDPRDLTNPGWRE